MIASIAFVLSFGIAGPSPEQRIVGAVKEMVIEFQ
jgi:hypothetical protein